MDYVLRPEPLADLLQSVSDMAALFEQLPLSPKHEGWFRRRAWVRTIHGTTHIEGNTLNDDEVEEVLLSGPEDFSRRDALEVLNTRAATRFADAIADDHDLPIGEAFVREVHRRVLQDLNPLHRPGEYRRGENRVTDGRGRLIFSTPISGDVPDLMQQFGAWLSGESDSEPGPVAAALAHLELVGVHPFYDGNGRTARAPGRTLFRRHAYKFRSIVSLDAQLDTDRDRYFEAI